MGGYTQDERVRRWALARKLMDEEGVEGLIVYGPTAYFTGSRTEDPDGTIVVLPRHGEPTALVVAPTPATWMATKVDSNAFGITDLLTTHRLNRSELGVVGLEPYPSIHQGRLLPYTLWHDVTNRLPHAKFRSVWPGLMRGMAAQSAEELAVLAESARIGRQMVEAVMETAHSGVRETALRAAASAVASTRAARSLAARPRRSDTTWPWSRG